MPRVCTNEYAVYKGDKFIVLGTARECADYMNIDVNTIYFYLSPAYKKRVAQHKEVSGNIIVIKLEDEVIA